MTKTQFFVLISIFSAFAACLLGISAGSVFAVWMITWRPESVIASRGGKEFTQATNVQVLVVPTTAIPLPTATLAPTNTLLPATSTQAPVVIQFSPTPFPSRPDCILDQHPQVGKVTRVVDGDTIRVLIDGRDFVVRYIGIDSPESTNQHEFLGPEASVLNANLVDDKDVVLYRDRSETDRFDRLLRYVFVGDRFVNAELVRAGMAEAVDYPPDTACSVLFAQAMSEAQQASIGLWSAAAAAVTLTPSPFLSLPTLTSVLASTVPTQTPASGITGPGYVALTPGCDIKGNIDNEGKKIYHVPGMRDYNKTKIDESAGEQWFCSEMEAVNQGWRRAEQ